MRDNKKQHSRIIVSHNSSVHAYLIHSLSAPPQETVFIFSHGFSVDGTESRRMFIEISNELSDLGYPCILFDYRGNGYSDLAFEDMTFDSQIEDLNAVMDFARKEFPDYKLAVWGMSFGCAVAAHAASQRSDLSLLVLWCLSADLFPR